MSKILKFHDFVNESYENSESMSINEEKDSNPKKPSEYKNVKDEDFVFAHGGKVDGWHFPINTKKRARNALARANQYDSSPDWYSGSLKSLVTKVANAVSKKYPDIEVSDKSRSPGKG